jgi:hypothetical protein
MSNDLTVKNQRFLYRHYFPDDENRDGSRNIDLISSQPHEAAGSLKTFYSLAGIDRLSLFSFQNTTNVLLTLTFISVLCEVRDESTYLVLLLKI